MGVLYWVGLCFLYIYIYIYKHSHKCIYIIFTDFMSSFQSKFNFPQLLPVGCLPGWPEWQQLEPGAEGSQ